MNVLNEAGQDFVILEETIDEDGEPDLLLTLDRTKIESIGVPAMGKFLEKLQVYRSIGDYESGKKLFDSYSQFDDKWLKWREIIIAKQKPKTMMIQANTLIEGIKHKYYRKKLLKLFNIKLIGISNLKISLISRWKC